MPPEAVAVVGVTSHWSGTVAVDARGQHLMNAILWMDSRGARHIRDVTGGPVRLAGYDVRKLRRFISRAGGLPSHSGKDPTAHIHWIRHERPDVYAATAVFLEPADYLNLRLTGRACSSYDCIALHWVAESATRRRCTTTTVWSGCPGSIPRGCRSWCRRPPSSAGCVSRWRRSGGCARARRFDRERRRRLGRGRVGGGADYAGHIYIGTSSWLSCHVPWKRTDLRHNQTTLPSPLPGRYFVANEQETAGGCLSFLAENLRVRPEGLPDDAGPDDLYRALDALGGPDTGRRRQGRVHALAERRAQSGGRPTLRGGFHNALPGHDPGRPGPSVYEGTAYNTRWLLGAVERFVRRRLPSLVFIGGGAGSALWAQIHADVLDRTIRRRRTRSWPTCAGPRSSASSRSGCCDPRS